MGTTEELRPWALLPYEKREVRQPTGAGVSASALEKGATEVCVLLCQAVSCVSASALEKGATEDCVLLCQAVFTRHVCPPVL
jgi:hypothetical protein